MVHDESWRQLREKVHRVNRRLAAAKTEAAFLRLTEDERKAVVGRYDLHLSYEELATMLGEPSPEAARAAVVRALKGWPVRSIGNGPGLAHGPRGREDAEVRFR